MSSLSLGNLSIGEIPAVVGTVSSFTTLQAVAAQRGEKAFDIIEARLDLIGEDHPWIETCRAIEASGTPVILTLRSHREGGKSAKSNQERLVVFEQALQVVSAVDVEWESGMTPDVAAVARGRGKALVVSYHDFEKTPALGILADIVTQSSKTGRISKISTMVRHANDVDILKLLLVQKGDYPLCVLGMGSEGTSTRTDFPLLGSCLTYGYIDTAAAPGQLSCRALVEHLRRNLPAYERRFSARLPRARAEV